MRQQSSCCTARVWVVAGDGPFTLPRAAAVVVELIRSRCHGRAHLCGLSLGAMVALQLAQDAPDLVASLTLSAGQIHPIPLLMGLQRIIMAVIPERAFTETLAHVFEQGYPDLVEMARSSARRAGKRGVLAAVRAAARADFRALLPAITASTLVLCGNRDRANLPAA